MNTTVAKASSKPRIRRAKLYESKDGTVVLATEDSSTLMFPGVVVHPSNAEEIGFYTRDWAAGMFTPFHGTLTMEQ